MRWSMVVIVAALACARAPELATTAAPSTSVKLGQMGTPHPFVLKDGSLRYGWVIGCQPRRDTDEDGRVEITIGRHGDTHGDELDLYLFAGSGLGVPLDAYLGRSPGGRYAAVRRYTPFVIDIETGREFAIQGSHPREDQGGRFPFSRRRQVAYQRDEGDTSEIVVLDLSNGQEHVAYRPAASAKVYDYELASDGSSLVVHELADDTNGNGRLDWPEVVTNLDSGRCSAPAHSSTTFGTKGDRPIARVVSLPRAWGSIDEFEEPEELHYEAGCLPSGRPVVARSSIGGVLVARDEYLSVPFGPVGWSRETVTERCNQGTTIATCTALGPRLGEFCVAGKRSWPGPEFFRYEDLRHVVVHPKLAWAFGDRGRILRWNGTAWTALPLPESSPVLALGADGARAWVSTSLRTFEWDGAAWLGRSGAAQGAIVGIVVAKQPTGITSEGALLRFDGGAWRVVVQLVRSDQRFVDQPTDVAKGTDGDIWVTTTRGRLLRWDGSRLFAYDSGTRLPLGRIARVERDAVWLHDGSELVRFRP
jgi:hypothetical protein